MTDPALAIALPFITGFEGFRASPYLDPYVWTIGYGFTFHADGSRVTESDLPITEAEGLAWMQALLVPVLARVRAMVYVPISDNAAGALVSFAYNCGTGALHGSTLLRLLNQGQTQAAADQFGAWIHDARGHVDPGLVRRRAAEKALFLTQDGCEGIPATKAENSRVLSTDAPDPSP